MTLDGATVDPSESDQSKGLIQHVDEDEPITVTGACFIE